MFYTVDTPPMSTADEIMEYIDENVEYCLDWQSAEPHLEYWQSPKETLALGTGDCDDIAILFMWLANEWLGIKTDMLLIMTVAGAHYVAVEDGIFYDPTHNWYGEYLPMAYTVILRIPYDVAMGIGTMGYTRSLPILDYMPYHHNQYYQSSPLDL